MVLVIHLICDKPSYVHCCTLLSRLSIREVDCNVFWKLWVTSTEHCGQSRKWKRYSRINDVYRRTFQPENRYQHSDPYTCSLSFFVYVTCNKRMISIIFFICFIISMISTLMNFYRKHYFRTKFLVIQGNKTRFKAHRMLVYIICPIRVNIKL